jgi:DNA repair protein RecO (recombination protein O)
VTKPRVYRTEAIILKAFDYGEADRILTVYTPHLGKLRAIAKGVRRTKSRMSGHLDLFTRSSLLVAVGRQLDIVSQADTLESYRPLREDLSRIGYAHYVCELVDAFAGEQQANFPLYALIAETLRRVADADDLALVTRSFEVQLLGLTGFRPQLVRCLQCGEEIRPEANRFSARLGGVLCPACGASDQSAPAITAGALKVMRNLQGNDAAMVRVRNLAPELHREVERHLHDYLVYRLEARPRSLAFLDRLRSIRVTP